LLFFGLKLKVGVLFLFISKLTLKSYFSKNGARGNPKITPLEPFP